MYTCIAEAYIKTSKEDLKTLTKQAQRNSNQQDTQKAKRKKQQHKEKDALVCVCVCVYVCVCLLWGVLLLDSLLVLFVVRVCGKKGIILHAC